MKQFKGTQGEWRLGYGEGLTGDTTAPTVYMDGEGISQEPISSGRYAICWVLKSGEFNEEEKANAKLIAAAPDLLNDAIDLLWLVKNYATNEEITERILKTEKSINKALGND